MLRKHRSQMEIIKQQVGTSLRGVANTVHATSGSPSQADAARRAQLAAGPSSSQVPIVGTPGHAQVNISQQAARLPAAGGTNMAVPTLAQAVPLPTGMNVNMQNFRRLSPQQQQAVYAQMQARHMQAAQAAQAQQQQQQQQQQHTSPPPPTAQATIALPGGVPQGQPIINTPTHTHTSPPQGHTTPHHGGAQTQISPPRHGTPANGAGLTNALVRPGSSQHVQPQAQRAGAGALPHGQTQARPGGAPGQALPQAQVPPVRQAGTSQQHQQHQHQQHQQQALHHAFLQNQNAHTGVTAAHQEQMKRLYQGPLYWVSVRSCSGVLLITDLGL